MILNIRSKKLPTNRETGIAVVSAMLLAALVVSIAANIVFGQQRFINRLENHFSSTQARWIGEASIEWSRAILAEDAKNGPVDFLKESWAIPLPSTPFEGGTIRGYIKDEQQYCNLNNLAQSNNSIHSGTEYFKRMFTSLGINPGAVDSLVDWIDADSDITYPYGAEDSHYLTKPAPYRIGNQLLTEIGNLSRVQGLTDQDIARLQQYCVVLPEQTEVNINTASAELLGLMLPELSQIEIQTIIAARDLHPIENIAEITQLLEHKKIVLSENEFSVGSHFFLVSSQTQFGKSTIRVEALLKRDGGEWPRLIWKRYR